MEEKTLIQACKNADRRAQQELYRLYSPRFLAICMRYVKNKPESEDVMIKAFFKIFKHIGNYEGKGSFEGWMKRIMINECLMFLRKTHHFAHQVEVETQPLESPLTTDAHLVSEDIKAMIAALPTGYRTVFNLYAIEGFKHREIAEMLGISVNTSKSQLIQAKKRLQEMIKKSEYYEAG